MLKTQVIGNVGRDAIMREINGNWALNFSVAHNERVILEGGEVRDKTIWVSCTRWMKKPSELQKYLKKGTLVHVAGTPSFRTYTNNDGIRDVDFKLKVESLELLSKAKEENLPEAKVQKTEAEKAQEVEEAFQD